MKWYKFVLGSSVGKKMLMAVTGLCLSGFLAVHLLGNFMAFGGAEPFNSYAKKLHSLEPFLTVFNIGLLVIGLVHVAVGIILFIENLRARPTRYAVYQNPGGRTLGSNTMPYTGVLILLFVIFHLLKFTFIDKSGTTIFEIMSAAFANPVYVGLYVLGMGVLAVHISHGFWSLFQTFGLNQPRYMPSIMNLGLAVTFVFGIGFASVPVYLFFFR